MAINEFLMFPRFNLVTKWFDCINEQWIYINQLMNNLSLEIIYLGIEWNWQEGSSTNEKKTISNF